MAEAVSLIINRQINELVLRCIKTNEVRHYYDIAVIGYGETAYSIWGGELEGHDFVSPQDLKDNPFKKIIVQEPKRTRSGIVTMVTTGNTSIFRWTTLSRWPLPPSRMAANSIPPTT